MKNWLGVNTSTSGLDETEGVSGYQQNADMRKDGELRRRRGFLSTSIARQSGPIKYIIGAFGLGSNFLTLGVGNDSVAGFLGTSQTGGPIDPLLPPQVPPQKIRPNGERECHVFPNWRVDNSGGEVNKAGGVLVFNFDNSPECGGADPGMIQECHACTIVNAGATGKTIVVSGMIEEQNEGFDEITVKLNGVEVIFMESEENGGGCTMVFRTDSVVIPPNSTAKVEVDILSNDERYHNNAYWQVMIS